MDAIKLVEKLSRKHGIKFSFDLPDPSEDSDAVGIFCPKDKSIHLTKDPSLYTIFHEVGHYLHHKKVSPYVRILLYSSRLSILLGLLFILFGSLIYARLSMYMGWLLLGISSLFVIDKKLNGEKRANEYAYAETMKLWIQEAES